MEKVSQVRKWVLQYEVEKNNKNMSLVNNDTSDFDLGTLGRELPICSLL